jgi:hypothetical protein
MELPIYKLIIDPEKDELGVSEYSIVDIPAMRTKWQMFKENKHAFVANEEKQILAFPIIAVDMPIYRKDEQGREYYVVFDAQTAEKVAYKAMRDNISMNWNIDHDPDRKTDQIQLVESYIVDRSKNKGVVEGHEHVMCGSWYGYAKINDPQLWQDAKEGKFNGVSLEGLFIEVPMQQDPEPETLIDLLLK